MQTRKVAYAVILTAMAVALSPFSISIGPAKAFPAQHMVSLLAAVILGPWFAVGSAAATSIIRLATGTGTIFAFPGSLFGAFIAGCVYRWTRNIYFAAVGEVIGTGIIGAFASTLLVAPVLLNQPLDATFYVIPFTVSAGAGVIIGIVGLSALQRSGVGRAVISAN